MESYVLAQTSIRVVSSLALGVESIPLISIGIQLTSKKESEQEERKEENSKRRKQ